MFSSQSKRVIIISGLLILMVLIVTKKFISSRWSSKNAAYTIGIIQTASHPALDEAAKGFKDYFATTHAGGVFVTRNIQADVAQAHSVARSFNNRASMNALFAIGTLTAQAAVQTKKDKPIAIACVSNPEENEIWSSEGLVCGSSDTLDSQQQLSFIKKVCPHLKVLGILYSLYEPNASFCAQQMKQAAQSEAIVIKEYGISQPSDIALVVQRIKDCDAVWCPTDNTVAISLDTIIHHLSKNQALILSDNLLMKNGVYATIGVDYYTAGQQAAACLSQVLFEGKKPYQIPLAYPILSNVVVSKHLAEYYNHSLIDQQDKTVIWVD